MLSVQVCFAPPHGPHYQARHDALCRLTLAHPLMHRRPTLLRTLSCTAGPLPTCATAKAPCGSSAPSEMSREGKRGSSDSAMRARFFMACR